MCKLRAYFNFCLLLGRWKHWKYFHIHYATASIGNMTASPIVWFKLHEWGHLNIYSIILTTLFAIKLPKLYYLIPSYSVITNQLKCEGLCDDNFHSKPWGILSTGQLVSMLSPHHMSPHNICTETSGQSNTLVSYCKRRETGQSEG